jgi:hypothetical protein
VHLSVHLACAQDDVEEDHEDLERSHQIPSDRVDVHQFVGEQNMLNRTVAPNISGNSQHLEFFLLYFQTILAVTVQESSRYMQ